MHISHFVGLDAIRHTNFLISCSVALQVGYKMRFFGEDAGMYWNLYFQYCHLHGSDAKQKQTCPVSSISCAVQILHPRSATYLPILITTF